MKFTILQASNGLILTWYDPEIQGTVRRVFEEIEGKEVESFASFLYALNDILGPNTSRYSPQRIYIDIRPGDKHEDYREES